ncbi:ribonuclease E/G [Thalassobaculum sp.]|uniref:ribonuclease E/G n=1 Tax=Thalassobaculum sp. TaxID=2022740 RepID=UPI0032EE9200
MSAVNRAVIDVAPGVSRVLFLEADRVVEIWVEGDDRPSLIGGIALVTARTAGGASVADLPTGAGYIRDGRANDGERLPVEVVRDSVDTKRSVLRRRVELMGDGVVLTPFLPELGIASAIRAKGRRAAIRDAVRAVLPDGVGAMVLAGAVDGAPTEDSAEVATAIAAETARLVDLWQRIRTDAEASKGPCWLLPPPPLEARVRAHAPSAEVVTDRDGRLFREAGGDEALERALARELFVADGVTLVVEEMETATLVDVNLARSPRGEALVRANGAAAAGVARIARLRGLRGTLLIDLPRMRGNGDRDRVKDALEQAVSGDAASWRILGWTPGGMLECVREAPRRPLSAEMLAPPGAPRLTARARAWAAMERLRRDVGGIARPVLRVPPDVATWLGGPGAPILGTERRRLGALTVAGDPTLGPEDALIDSDA